MSLAADVAFRKHVIDAEAQFCAACVFDVNHDGKLDIVCGSNWYEAPTWKKHFVRDVEALGNPPRYDGYAHLPMDVNGDGWTDVITVNYRSKSLKWLEHPGSGFGPWKAHTIDEPGPMETGRLVDIDADGQLDILPNGVQVAGWWELVREKNADGIVTPHFIRHDLPREIAGHGVGFGDIDGDGRDDIVGPRGWLQAPLDRRAERWLWHPEFDLDTASVPILVVDVNGDGHNDIVWGRAHNFGLYWLEQDASDSKQRRWIKHTIDTSWGGAHSPLWADLDGDGVPELIAGKRYLPHEGRDPGEYDPLVSYRYQFDRATHTWKRWPISIEDGVGFGLDPKVVDLDGDGDLDLVCADRCGLCWLENLRISPDAATPPQVESATPTYEDHTQLMVVKDRNGAPRPITTAFDWSLRRAHLMSSTETFLGALPDSYQRVPLDVKAIDEKSFDGFVSKKISFAIGPGERISATLLLPASLPGKAPAVVCLAQSAQELAKRGYICLVPEYPADAGAAMKYIWNNIRALDLLETLPEVNIDALGCIAEGANSRLALYTAAFDQRIAATVCQGKLTTIGELHGKALVDFARDAKSPRLRERYEKQPTQIPFDLAEVVAAIAPRSINIISPLDDADFSPNGVRQAIASAVPVFKLRGVEQKLHAVFPGTSRGFSDAERADAFHWLDDILKKPAARPAPPSSN
ncbi:MAG TPA: VCBS repeat-containing protein [Pirellulales bacterium]